MQLNELDFSHCQAYENTKLYKEPTTRDDMFCSFKGRPGVQKVLFYLSDSFVSKYIKFQMDIALFTFKKMFPHKAIELQTSDGRYSK